MRRVITVIGLCALALFTACVSTSKTQAASGLVSLDEALAEAATDVGSHVSEMTEIAIAGLDSPLSEVSDFLEGELSTYLTRSGKFKVLARGSALEALEAEHQFQMSGFVDDESAVGIGHYLGAKVVITGSFKRFEGFSYLRLRAIDVRSSLLFTEYTARIRPDDVILASVMKPLDDIPLVAITEEALAYLDQGEDLLREGRYDEAKVELDRTLEVNNGFTDVYLLRSIAYNKKLGFLPITGQITYSDSRDFEINGTVLVGYRGNATNVTIPEGITRIEDGAFGYNRSITGVTIPSSVTYIGDRAFYWCFSLRTVVISTVPQRVIMTHINAFPPTAQITYITPITPDFEINGTVLQRYNGNTANVTIPESVTSIGRRAFAYNNSLTSVTIPMGITNIGLEAFLRCTSLTNITIPSSVTYIGMQAFAICTSLTSITIPSGAGIELSAFVGCTSLTSITIQEGVTFIGDSAFSGCTSLTSVTIPSSVTSIGESAFAGCTNLRTVTISRRTRIGEDAFPATAQITYRD